MNSFMVFLSSGISFKFRHYMTLFNIEMSTTSRNNIKSNNQFAIFVITMTQVSWVRSWFKRIISRRLFTKRNKIDTH